MKRAQRGRRTVILMGGACAAVMLIYVGSYLFLRATHRIRHISNSRHWVAEKREPEHRFEGGEQAAFAIFQPLVRLEGTCHRAVDFCLFY